MRQWNLENNINIGFQIYRCNLKIKYIPFDIFLIRNETIGKNMFNGKK